MQNLRKFIIVEGLSSNTGRICHLKKIVEIAKKTKCRIILDESNSLGLISFKGGLAKCFEVPPSDIDIIIGSFSNTLDSVGGYSVGSFFVTDHQVILYFTSRDYLAKPIVSQLRHLDSYLLLPGITLINLGIKIRKS